MLNSDIILKLEFQAAASKPIAAAATAVGP